MLDANQVHDVFMDCFYPEEKTSKEAVSKEALPILDIHGAMVRVGFDPDKIKANEEKINAFLEEVPDVFRTGANFTLLCNDKEGNLWGQHVNCDELLILGLAIDRFHYLLPREIWTVLPGGLPYIILDKKEEEQNDGR